MEDRNTTLLYRIKNNTGCLIGIIMSMLLLGILVGILGLSLYQTFEQQSPTPTPKPCQIGLDTERDLYDTIDAFVLNQLPIGELEIGVYPVVAQTDGLLAVDWRGSLPSPPPLIMLDWIEPDDGVDELSGDCDNVIRIVLTPTPIP